jgi:nitroreductase
VDVLELMRTTGTARFYKPDPVPDELLYRAFESARFGPQGGNRQPVRWIVVRDPGMRQKLRDIYVTGWDAYLRKALGGDYRVDGNRILEAADQFAKRLHEVPVLLVVCARMQDLWISDADLPRQSIVGGASVYPTVQNFCLACRALGLATAITTVLCQFESEVKDLLGIPDEYATAAHLAVGFPANGFPSKLKRRPVEEVAFAERFGDPWSRG